MPYLQQVRNLQCDRSAAKSDNTVLDTRINIFSREIILLMVATSTYERVVGAANRLVGARVAGNPDDGNG